MPAKEHDTGHSAAAVLTSADHADPTIRQRLGNRAAVGVMLTLASAVGACTAGGLWVSIDSLRTQAEEAGRQAAITTATAFGELAEPLRAQTAATGMLVEAAASAGRGTACIEDAPAEIAWRSPIRRTDITAADCRNYATGQSVLRVDELEPEFALLATTRTPGRTAAAAATQTGARLTKTAAVKPMHRPTAVRIEQQLDGLTAARTCGDAGDRQARKLAHDQAAAFGERRFEELAIETPRRAARASPDATADHHRTALRTGRGDRRQDLRGL